MRALVYGLLLVVSASTALAAPRPKEVAKRRIDRAAALHKQGKFDDALAELEAAYKLDPQVDLLFAIGQVYAKLGRCDEARTEYEEFAAKKKSKEASQIVQQAIAGCIPKAPPVPPPAAVEPVAPPAPPPVEHPAEPLPVPATRSEPAPPTPPPTLAAATSGPPSLRATVQVVTATLVSRHARRRTRGRGRRRSDRRLHRVPRRDVRSRRRRIRELPRALRVPAVGSPCT